VKVLSLFDLIKRHGEDAIKNTLSSFCVRKDKDVEKFIQQLAVPYELSHNSRTFIISSDKGDTLGFISIALNVIQIPNNLSKKQISKIRGFGRSCSDFIPCYLIGQLARFDNVPKDYLSLLDLLSIAFSIIKKMQSYCGGRFVCIDCKDSLLEKYKNFEFESLGKTAELNHLIKFII